MTAVHEPEQWISLPGRDITLDDVVAMAAADELHRYELDEGALLIMPRADGEHSSLIIRIGSWLVAHGYGDDRVLATPGLRITERSGRSPDLLVLRSPAPTVVWHDPPNALLAIEIVSKGSEKLDRLIKPAEYAGVGIPHYWRVERSAGPPTVHMYQLGSGPYGESVYLSSAEAIPLDKLLAGEPPRL